MVIIPVYLQCTTNTFLLIEKFLCCGQSEVFDDMYKVMGSENVMGLCSLDKLYSNIW